MHNNLKFMKKSFVKGVGVLCLGLMTITSCEDDSLNVEDNKVEEQTTDEVNVEEQLAEISYSVPTPNELFEIVKSLGGELNVDLINPIENKDNYVDLKSKALNFGVYSADLGYMSCFENGIEFLKYTKAIENLGNELGISEVFDQELMDRISNNEDDFDSLFMISNETYYDSYLYLEENKKGQELSLIIIGGYIESLYIISNLVTEYADDNQIIEKIGDQKLVLENIIDFCAQYADELAVSEALSSIMELKSVFDENMDFVEANEAAPTEATNGVNTLKSNGSYVMNEKTFNIVKTEITKLRTNITQK